MDETVREFAARSFQFSCRIVRLYQKLCRIPDFPLILARQLLRAGTSIGANLEEAKASQSRRDLKAKFSIALKEARETKYWLRLIRATSLAPASAIDSEIDEADQLVAILTVSVRNLQDGVESAQKGKRLPG
jgi:four helix bundle protein